MRPFLIAGNWKMNCGPAETQALIGELQDVMTEVRDHVHVLICPPSVSLTAAAEALKKLSTVELGAQNFYYKPNGAYTGEISAEMLNEIGVNYVIVGHSERREYFCETDTEINKKVLAAVESGLRPILCVGEKLVERKAGSHFEVVKNQIYACLADVPFNRMRNVVIAYEPVWAIGTGETASPAQAQEMHAFIRSEIEAMYGTSVAGGIQILYGGSLKPDNARELLSQPDVDGGLIGGASLKAASFASIVAIANSIHRVPAS
jgi:triosephosphate isomerase